MEGAPAPPRALLPPVEPPVEPRRVRRHGRSASAERQPAPSARRTAEPRPRLQSAAAPGSRQQWSKLKEILLAPDAKLKPWYSLAQHEVEHSEVGVTDEARHAILELSGVAHTCRLASFGANTELAAFGRIWRDVAMAAFEPISTAKWTESTLTDGVQKLALLEESYSFATFAAKVRYVVDRDAAAIVITDRVAAMVEAHVAGGHSRTAETPTGAGPLQHAQHLAYLAKLPVPVVVLPVKDAEFILDEMPQWARLTQDSRAALDDRVLDLRRVSPQLRHESSVAKEALAAAHRGHWQFLESFAREGVDLFRVRDARGRTLLMLCAAYDRGEVLAELHRIARRRDVQQGLSTVFEEEDSFQKNAGSYAHADDRDARGRTAVMHAVLKGKTKALKILLEAPWHADARAADGLGLNPLKMAVKQGQVDAAVLLLRHGAWQHSDAQMQWGRDVARIAVENGQVAVIDELYQQHAKNSRRSRGDGANRLDIALDSDHGSPLLHAVRFRKFDIVSQLLKPYGDARGEPLRIADVGACDSQGRNALHEACILGHDILVVKLMQHVHGWPTAWYGGETAVSLNAQDWTGRTALMHAAARGYERVVIAMCDRLNQTLTDRTDSLDANVGEYATARTALHLAALCAVERVHTIRALCIHAAADVSATDYRGQTALHLAAARKNVAIIRELLDHNADVGVRDKNGNTGAVVDAANAWGDTSLHIALLLFHTFDKGLAIRVAVPRAAKAKRVSKGGVQAATAGFLQRLFGGAAPPLTEKRLRSASVPSRLPRRNAVVVDRASNASGSSDEEDGTSQSSVSVSDSDCDSDSEGAVSQAFLLKAPGAAGGASAVRRSKRFEGVVEQLLKADATLARENRKQLEAFSRPLQEHYFWMNRLKLEEIYNDRNQQTRIGRLYKYLATSTESAVDDFSWRVADVHQKFVSDSTRASLRNAESLVGRRAAPVGAPAGAIESPPHPTRPRSGSSTSMDSNRQSAAASPILKRSASFRAVLAGSDDEGQGKGLAAYDLLYGNKRIQTAVNTKWREVCLAQHVLMLVLYLVFVALLTVLAMTVVTGSSSNTALLKSASAEFRHGLLSSFTAESTAARRVTAMLSDDDGAGAAFHEKFPDHSEAVGFEQVRSGPDFFFWLESTFETAITDERPTRWEGAAVEQLGFGSGGVFLPGFGLVMGLPRLKQWRSDFRQCQVADRLDSKLNFCFKDSVKKQGGRFKDSWKWGQRRPLSTASFSIGALLDSADAGVLANQQAYRWRSGRALDEKSRSRGLRYARYPSGGFAVDVPLANATARTDLFGSLYHEGWLDAATRAVTLDLVVYNANVNLFCVVLFAVEFPAEGGGGIATLQAEVARMWPYLAGEDEDDRVAGGDGRRILALEAACFIFVLFFLVQEIYQGLAERENYVASPWNLLDVLFFVCAFAYVATRLQQVYSARLVPWNKTAHLGETFRHCMVLGRRHVSLLSMMNWVTWIRVLQYLQVWKPAAILVLEIVYMIEHLTTFGVIMCIVCMAFASAEYIEFGWSDRHYRTLLNSLGMNWGSAFGEVAYWDILTTDDAPGSTITKLLMVLYIFIVVLLLMNLIIALLNEQSQNAHERSAKYWCAPESAGNMPKEINRCFVQFGMIKHTTLRNSLLTHFANRVRFCCGPSPQHRRREPLSPTPSTPRTPSLTSPPPTPRRPSHHGKDETMRLLRSLKERVCFNMDIDNRLAAPDQQRPSLALLLGSPPSAASADDAVRGGTHSRSARNLATWALDKDPANRYVGELIGKTTSDKLSAREACAQVCAHLLQGQSAPKAVCAESGLRGKKASHFFAHTSGRDSAAQPQQPPVEYDEWFDKHCCLLYPEIDYFEGQDLQSLPGEAEISSGAAKKERLDRLYSVELLAHICAKSAGGYDRFRARSKSLLCDGDLDFLRDQLLHDFLFDEAHLSGEERAANLDGLFVILAIANLGKIKAFADDVAVETRMQSVDHNLILRNALSACPGLLPSFKRLNDEQRRRVFAVVSSNFNLGQFLQGESVPASLEQLRHAVQGAATPRDGRVVLRLALFVWVVRVPFFTKSAPTFKAVRDACDILLGLDSAFCDEVYDDFFVLHAKTKQLALPVGRDFAERHLARLVLMMRITAPADAAWLRRVFNDQVGEADQLLLKDELGRTGFKGWAVLVYYAPNLLQDSAKLGTIKAPGNAKLTEDGLLCGLAVLADLFRAARCKIAENAGDGVYSLSVLPLCLKAKEAGMSVPRFRSAARGFSIEHMGDEGLVNLAEAAARSERRGAPIPQRQASADGSREAHEAPEAPKWLKPPDRGPS